MNEYKQYLPSKKFLIILSSIIVALVLIFVSKTLINLNNQNNKKLTVAEKKEIALREEFLTIDSDSDGLKDWEESLWQTDSKVADTDGDGTNDGDEIKAYRDPLKPNTASKGQEPNDKFDATEVAKTKKMMDEYAALNETEKFSRTLFSNFLATKKIDSEMTKTDVIDFVNNTLTEMPEKTLSQKYTINDLDVLISSKEIDLKNYTKSMKSILEANLLPYINKNLTIFQDAITNSDPSKLKELDKSIGGYKNAISAVLKTKTPSIYTEDHLTILNSLDDILSTTEDMKIFFDNPIVLMPSINLFPVVMSNLYTSLQNIGLL